MRASSRYEINLAWLGVGFRLVTLKGSSQLLFPASYPFSRQVCFKETHLSFSKDFKMSELRFCLKKKDKMFSSSWVEHPGPPVGRITESQNILTQKDILRPCTGQPQQSPPVPERKELCCPAEQSSFQHQLTWRPADTGRGTLTLQICTFHEEFEFLP